MTIIYAVILFVLLIFPHELGHFLAAKSVGVRVNEFAFGMGPAIFQKQKGETLYSVRLVPVGGYCAMEGEDEAVDEESDDGRSFQSKPAWAKIFVLISGAGMNVLISIIVLSLMVGIVGSATTTLDQVQKGAPAWEAGIRPGDKILAVDGEETDTWKDVALAIREDGEEKQIVVERKGSRRSFDVTPVKTENGYYAAGFTCALSHNPLTAVKAGVIGTWNLGGFMFDALKQLVTGEVPASELSGPVGIVTMAGDTAKYGANYFAGLIALMSMNLALINLLPLPALDGGRILFVIIRKITGRRITEEMEGKIHGLGMMMLLGLMIFVTWNDIMRLLL